MADVVDEKTRSRMMSAIRGKNTKPELSLRRLLHAAGFRYRLYSRAIPGKPDLVMPKYRLAIFVHGCFWHRHHECAFTTVPKSNSEFWATKFARNVERDRNQYEKLRAQGWRVLIVWECGIRKSRQRLEELIPLIKAEVTFYEWPEYPPVPA
jgi:DNA mismatch endonuclease (patch repair protein)